MNRGTFAALKTAKSKLATRPILGNCFFLTLIFGKCFGEKINCDGMMALTTGGGSRCTQAFYSLTAVEQLKVRLSPIKLHIIIDSSDLIIDTIFRCDSIS